MKNKLEDARKAKEAEQRALKKEIEELRKAKEKTEREESAR